MNYNFLYTENLTSVEPRGKVRSKDILSNKVWIEDTDALNELECNFKSNVGDHARVQKTVKYGKVKSFRILGVVTDSVNHGCGIGLGKGTNKVQAKLKSFKKGQKNIQFLDLGCGSLSCEKNCKEKHSFKKSIVGVCGSTRIRLMPAPKGTGIVGQPALRTILESIGITDLRVSLKGSDNRLNCITALDDAFKRYIVYLE
jgi:small subunit ribosomal protein S5